MLKTTRALVLALILAPGLFAFDKGGIPNCPTNSNDPKCVVSGAAPDPAVPEIDPLSGMSALTLLAGAVVVIRGWRKK